MINVTMKEEKIKALIAEIIEEMYMQGWCSQTGVLLGRFKQFEIQLIVTRDEDQIMGADCNKRLVSCKA